MLNSLNFSIVESNQLLNFGKGITSLFVNFNAAQDKYTLAPFVKKALNAYTDFGKAYERDLKNPFTIELSIADAKRDAAFNGFRDYTVAYSHSDEAEIKAAADRIIAVIMKHGFSAAYFGYKAETAALTKIMNELKDIYMSDIQLLNASQWFDKLVTTQAFFDDLQKKSASQPPSGLPTIVETRPKMVNALRKLMNMVDNHYTENPTDAELAGYVNSMNELITLTMTTARAAQTRSENKKLEDKTTVGQVK